MTASCESPVRDRLLVAIGGQAIPGEELGELAPAEYTLGEILQLTPDDDGLWSLRKVTVVPLRGHKIPREPGSEEVKFLSKIKILADDEVERASAALHVRVLDWLDNPTRVSLADVSIESDSGLAVALNLDSDLAQLIRRAGSDRFLVVSEVVYGTGLAVLQDGGIRFKPKGINVVQIGNLHVHFSFECDRIAEFRRRAKNADTRLIPMVVKYSALRYDTQSGRVLMENATLSPNNGSGPQLK